MFNLTPVVKNLLIINIAVFAGSMLLDVYNEVVYNFALFYLASDNFRAWQFVTYMFLHGDLWHLIGNMFGLLIFGTWLEEVWGSKRFLQYYLITGIGAAVLFMGVEYLEMRQVREDVNTFLLAPDPGTFELLLSEHYEQDFARNQAFIRAYGKEPENEGLVKEATTFVKERYVQGLNVPMLGASGAIFGVLLAAGLLFPHRRIMLLFPPIPLRARIFVMLYGAYEVYSLLQRAPNDNVAHMAHLGGMIVGLVLLMMWGEARNRYQ